MVRIIAFAFTALLAASCIATPTKRTTLQILDALSAVKTQTVKLDKDLQSFPASGGTLAAALAIHGDVAPLNAAVKSATAAVVATGKINAADSKTILDSAQAIDPVIKDALSQVTAKKPGFQALQIGGIPKLVKADLNDMNVTCSALVAGVIVNIDPSSAGTANAIKNDLTAAFATAITAYANV